MSALGECPENTITLIVAFNLVCSRMGGIHPPLAADFHRENIEQVVQEAMDNANVQLKVSIVKGKGIHFKM